MAPVPPAADPDPRPAADPQTDPVRQLDPDPELDPGALRRRLDRLRFDLHDGPRQAVHLLAEDLRLFRSQLEPLLAGHPDRARALGRLDDLDAQVQSLDEQLRRLSAAVQQPLSKRVEDALDELTSALRERAGIVPELELSGDLGRLSDSQRFTVVAIVRESLANIRRHSRARRVRIRVAADADGVTVSVCDDGIGFSESAAEQAARAGHLGLVGMRERVRMLGGQFRVQSRPGGPTIVSARLRRWPA
ncbi:MAG TPA: ATP-binding protein [Solirubrobacteraceae bacterium]|nr:ATP-binding protein [Solirubrobacteraceae bacterium]